MSLIGQFGVGFYSVYLIADKVRVISKNNDDDQYVWESTADSSFTVAPDPRGNTLGRGTEITMFLKEDAIEFTKQDTLEELIKRYSEFITFPIKLYKKTVETVEIEYEEEEDDESSADSTTENEDGVEVAEEEEESSDSQPKTEQVTTWDWHHINNNVAIWSRDSSEVSDEEYKNFYTSLSQDSTEAFLDPFQGRGRSRIQRNLYVPNDPLNLYDNYADKQAGVRLYVRKVLIQEDFDELLPKYLNFLKGVVDSDDLPLNVSRETLQQHKILKVMGKKLVRKALEMLRKLATEGKTSTGDDNDDESENDNTTAIPLDDPEHPYIKFWENFWKEYQDGRHGRRCKPLQACQAACFKSSTSDDKWVSLENYVENMHEWQKEIYYLAGMSMDEVSKSPFLEVARKKNVEVLYLTDPVDEYVFQHVERVRRCESCRA